jgi:sensor histidine kinase YesM
MKEPDRDAASNHSLLYLQLVFALVAGMLNVPLDLVGQWLVGKANPATIPYTKFHLLSAVVFASITFCAWRWIIPRLRGVLVLRLLVQVMLGIVMFGYGLFAAFQIWLHVANVPPGEAILFARTPAISSLIVICGATLYMILGGLSLDSASQEQLRLRELALTAQLEALRSQLNHHFLFNSLNVIAEAAAVQPERAEKLILQLAGVLRYSLGASRARMAPLSEELAAVASYLELERARSGNRIIVNNDIAADVGEIRVPPLLIQPLVENAVGHGLLNGTCAGTISISAWRNDDSLCIRVEDDGVGFQSPRAPRKAGEGVGLSNLRERLRAFYGENAAFHLHSSVGGGTVAEVSLALTDRTDSARARRGLVWRGFFWYLGSVVSLLAFALSREVLGLGAIWSLLIGQAVEVSYLLGASAADETKTFDVAIVVYFFAGQVCALAGSIELFVNYAAGWLYASCAAVAAIPQLFGAEPFTEYWMRQAYPAWLQRGGGFARIANRVSAAWAIVFVVLAGISFHSPVGVATNWPAYVFVLGAMVPALSAIYPSSRIYRAGLKTASAENFVLGLPFLFDKRRAPAGDFSVQFIVSGTEPGSYYVEIRDGVCLSGQGDLKEPNLTIYCGTESWALVGRGELSPERAVDEGLLRLRGSAQDFAEFFRSFRLPIQAGAHRSGPRMPQRVRNSAA